VVSTLIGGATLIGAFAAWERRAPEPMLPPHLFRNRTFVAANLTGFSMIAGLFAAAFLISQYFQFVLGDSPLRAGLHLLPWTAAPLLVAPVAGKASDRIGRRPVYALGALGLAAFAFLFFGLIGSGDFGQAVLGIVVALLLHGAMYGPQAAFITELFPTRYRYSGASIAYQLTSIVAGSLAPIIATLLYQRTHSWLPVAVYVGACCAVSGVTALLARETRGIDLAAIR
jgi:MFS family permease